MHIPSENQLHLSGQSCSIFAGTIAFQNASNIWVAASNPDSSYLHQTKWGIISERPRKLHLNWASTLSPFFRGFLPMLLMHLGLSGIWSHCSSHLHGLQNEHSLFQRQQHSQVQLCKASQLSQVALLSHWACNRLKEYQHRKATRDCEGTKRLISTCNLPWGDTSQCKGITFCCFQPTAFDCSALNWP